jgi:hypothetical protein
MSDGNPLGVPADVTVPVPAGVPVPITVTLRGNVLSVKVAVTARSWSIVT